MVHPQIAHDRMRGLILSVGTAFAETEGKSRELERLAQEKCCSRPQQISLQVGTRIDSMWAFFRLDFGLSSQPTLVCRYCVQRYYRGNNPQRDGRGPPGAPPFLQAAHGFVPSFHTTNNTGNSITVFILHNSCRCRLLRHRTRARSSQADFEYSGPTGTPGTTDGNHIRLLNLG